MKTAIAEIQGIGAISFSRRYDLDVPMLDGESPDAYDLRTWRERLHYDPKTKECFVPGTVLKKALDYTAAQLGMKIKGRQNKTWVSIFKSGVICADRMLLGVTKDKVEMITVLCSSTGKPGGAQVPRRFPLINDWGGTATFMILNDMITESVFRTHLERAGQFCGLGRYAPRNGGFHGRFKVTDLLWHDEVAV